MTRATRPRAVFRRVVTPAAKFWICKRAPSVTLEAMEVLGGSGYIEESIMPRLYREAPVNSIWEGSGNVMCLDVLRAIERTPKAAEVLQHELADAGDARLQGFRRRGCNSGCAPPTATTKSQARVLVRDLVLALQAALLIKHAPPAVADAFCASRLSGRGRRRLRHAAARARSARARRARGAAKLKFPEISPAPAPPAPQSRPRRRACAAPECRAHRR